MILVLLIVGAGVFVHLNLNGWSTYEIGIGGFRRVPLSDGSVVDVNTDSEVRIRLSNGVREIHLVRGEARFKVAHEPNRPFVVQAGDTVVRAVGTEFDIRVFRREHVSVAVIEGAVRVNHHSPQPALLRAFGAPLAVSGSGAILVAGNEATDIAGGVSIAQLSDAETRFYDGWRHGRLLFEDSPLEQVVAEFNRYHVERIRIRDPSLARLKVGGAFNPGDRRAFVERLKELAALDVREVAGAAGRGVDFELYSIQGAGENQGEGR